MNRRLHRCTRAEEQSAHCGRLARAETQRTQLASLSPTGAKRLLILARAALLLATATLLPITAHAASRGQFGGTLRIAAGVKRAESDPLLADHPQEAALLSLVARGLCRPGKRGEPVPALAASVEQPNPSLVRITFRPNVQLEGGVPFGPKEAAAALTRVLQPASQSPYRALLYPLRFPIAPGGATTLDLPLNFPWPDLERTLCHPALAMVAPRGDRWLGLGPFRASREPGALLAQPGYPEGRPYFDRITLLTADPRGAARMLASKRAEVAFHGADEASAGSGPALYATYLGFQRKKVGPDFRPQLEAILDRGDLTRFFVRGPAVPMERLLPPALHPNAESLPRPQPGPAARTREVTLLFDSSLDDHRAVAERIQLKLHDRGFKVALQGMPRAQLRARWRSGDYELMLHSLLLPPAPAPALAVAIEAAGRPDLLAAHLPRLGAVSDAAQRDARSREVADSLSAELELIPLYAQGVRLGTAVPLEGLGHDAQGLPWLDAAFFPREH
jgi:peptide/nickel transport system substrate-binding protein